jgi:phosphoglycerol transferase
VLGLLGFAQVRTWDRIVTFLAFFALLVCAIWFERLGERIRRRVRRPAPAVALLTVAVAGLALWDTVPPSQRDYPALTASWVSDQRFVDAIEQRMPDGAAIFQLPIVPFPENPPVVRMVDYDQYRGYIHDDGSLRWSYGGVKGRPIADWQVALRDRIDPVKALPALLGLGYDGVWVDTFGYADGGADIRAKLARVTRAKPLQSPNGRLLFFDLRPYKARLGRSKAELDAITERVLGFNPAKGPAPGG